MQFPECVFPRRLDYAYWSNGLTLRDYFAGQALAGFLSGRKEAYDGSATEADWFAGAAYDVADAMLRKRGAGQ